MIILIFLEKNGNFTFCLLSRFPSNLLSPLRLTQDGRLGLTDFSSSCACR